MLRFSLVSLQLRTTLLHPWKVFGVLGLFVVLFTSFLWQFVILHPKQCYEVVAHWRVWWCEPNGPHRCGWQSPWHRIKGCIGLGLRIGNPTFKVCFASPNYATAVPFDPNVYLLDQKSESTSQRQRSQKIHRGVKTKWVNVLKWGTPPSHLFGAKASFREDWDLKTPSFWATQHSVRKRSRTVLSSWLSTIQHWLSKAARPGLGCRVYHDYMVPF